MPETIRCPHCERKLRVPDNLLGRTVKCPGCATSFVAAVGEEPPRSAPPPPPPARTIDYSQSAAPPAAPSDGSPFQFFEDEEPAAEQPPARRRVWGQARTGMGYALGAVFTATGVFLVFILGCVVMAAGSVNAADRRGQFGGPADNELALLKALVAFLVLGMLTSYALQITAEAYCLGAPRDQGARGLAIASLILLLTSLVLWLPAWVLALFGEAANPMLVGRGASIVGLLNLVGSLTFLVQVFVFLFFLRAAALGAGHRNLAQSIVYLMVVGGAEVLIYLGMIGLIVVGAGAGRRAEAEGLPLMFLGCTCLFLIFGLGFLVWYIITLFQMRTAFAHPTR